MSNNSANAGYSGYVEDPGFDEARWREHRECEDMIGNPEQEEEIACLFGFQPSRNDSDNDHILPEGVEVVARRPPLQFTEWSTTDPTVDREVDPWRFLVDHDGEQFGIMVRYTSDGAMNAALRSFRTSPTDPRWRCMEWLNAVRDFAIDVVVATFGAETGINAQFVVYLDPDYPLLVRLFWRLREGGVLVGTRAIGRSCGTCFGCVSTPVNEEQAPDSWVYFVQAETGGPVKIGRSANPSARLASLQTAHPHLLRIVAKMAGGAEVERAMHRLFAASRIRPEGEWFNPTPDLVAFIKEVGGA